MTRTMSVTFLGTSSGGGPTATRNCSALVADVLADGSLWMVDCAEGTLRQFLRQPWSENHLKISHLKKIFITHMHADHVMGIISILRKMLFPPDNLNSTVARKPPTIEIYGPAGIRTFIRSILSMTKTRTAETYVCHELLQADDPITACEPPEVLHSSEVAGRDIFIAKDGFWMSITSGRGVYGEVFVDAGPIHHRDPCIGFVIRESVSPFRKIVILGDTYDPSHIVPLCVDPQPSLLIHEATDAHIPQSVDPKAKRSLDAIREKTLARGHSMPEMAGEFAKRIGAKKLVLNHIGGRFPASSPKDRDYIRASVIQEIEQQASTAWGMGNACVAWDYMTVGLPTDEAYVQYRDEEESGTVGREYRSPQNNRRDNQNPTTKRTQASFGSEHNQYKRKR